MTQEITQEAFDDAVLTITGHPEWSIVRKGLANDIYNAQAHMLDAPSWDQVNEMRGFCKGLAFVMNLRDTVTTSLDNEAANAAL